MKVVYVVQEGDCLTKIASKFKISVQKLAEFNGITNVDGLHRGQMLLIPSNGDVEK